MGRFAQECSPTASRSQDFAQWPTLPQVYIKGEFMGGSDTLFEMFKSGELDQLLNDKGVPRIKDKQ